MLVRATPPLREGARPRCSRDLSRWSGCAWSCDFDRLNRVWPATDIISPRSVCHSGRAAIAARAGIH